MLLSCNLTSMKVLDHVIQVKESLGLLMLFNMLGLVLLVLVNDLMVLFVVMELQSYSLYLITSAYNSSSNMGLAPFYSYSMFNAKIKYINSSIKFSKYGKFSTFRYK
ncbi:hypothetical protein DAMA08_020980 (mitochondrion) [Martiniozyma asiatica (nom. inval.)]|nr:hypothetical protein DAMA08_020980 [Martiniozyma asiatica]